MDRTQLEVKIVQSLTQKVNKLHFNFISEDYSDNFNHTVKYDIKVNHTTFIMFLRFMIPNYLKLQVRFYAYNDLVNKAYLQNCGSIELSDVRVVNFDYDEYFSSLYNEEKYGFYIKHDSGYDGVNIEAVVNKIYKRYFSHAVNELIPKMDSEDKLESIANADENFEEGEIELSDLCFPIQNQILAGVSLAVICKKEGYQQILMKYLDYCRKEYKNGEYLEIDCAVETILKNMTWDV